MNAIYRTRILSVALFLGCSVSVGYCRGDARVQSVNLNASGVTQIAISAGYVTTLLFPRPVSAIVGYGMTSDPSSEDGWVQFAHPGDSGMVTLRVLKADLKTAYMTVLVGDDLYSFELDNAPGSAALSVKLTDNAALPGALSSSKLDRKSTRLNSSHT